MHASAGAARTLIDPSYRYRSIQHSILDVLTSRACHLASAADQQPGLARLHDSVSYILTVSPGQLLDVSASSMSGHAQDCTLQGCQPVAADIVLKLVAQCSYKIQVVQLLAYCYIAQSMACYTTSSLHVQLAHIHVHHQDKSAAGAILHYHLLSSFILVHSFNCKVWITSCTDTALPAQQHSQPMFTPQLNSDSTTASQNQPYDLIRKMMSARFDLENDVST